MAEWLSGQQHGDTVQMLSSLSPSARKLFWIGLDHPSVFNQIMVSTKYGLKSWIDPITI